MKKIIIVALILIIGGSASFAQCGKQVILTSLKTEYLDGNGALQRTVDENSVIEINKSEITIIPGNEERKMTGTIKSDTCNWKTSFKEGKTIIRATFSKETETMNATITIEGKDRKIRIVADKFEEKI